MVLGKNKNTGTSVLDRKSGEGQALFYGYKGGVHES